MVGQAEFTFCLLACCWFYVRKFGRGGFVPSARFQLSPPGQAKGCSLIKTQCRKLEQNVYNATQCYSEKLVYVRTHEPNRRHTKNKNYLSFLPSASCEIPLDHANPCEPSKNTRASTVSSPNLLRVFVTTLPAAKKTRSGVSRRGRSR